MKMRWLGPILLLTSINLSASPYDDLAYALNQQTLLKDLRAQCEIDASIPDDKVKTVFLHSEVNHSTLSAASSALKNGQQAQYQQLMQTIRCPEIRK